MKNWLKYALAERHYIEDPMSPPTPSNSPKPNTASGSGRYEWRPNGQFGFLDPATIAVVLGVEAGIASIASQGMPHSLLVVMRSAEDVIADIQSALAG